jgi:uncharacterized protein (DUF1697 family)
MRTWIALLRGINVGGRNALPMTELVDILQTFNLKNVRTYIQSGNVVFQSSRQVPSKLAAKIATQIEKHRGFTPDVLILSAEDWQLAVDSNPFPEAESDPKTLHCFFLSTTPVAPDMETMSRAKTPAERFQLTDKVFYLHAPDGIGRSRLAAKVEKHLGVAATARNWRTVQKLLEMANST